MNLKPLFAAMALVCAFAIPSQASPNKALSFYIENPQGEGRSLFSRTGPSGLGKIAKSAKRDAVKAGRNALSIARSQLGTNPTKMRRLWCANWIGLVERKLGRSGTGSNLAKSYLKYGKRVSLAQARPGDIVITSRKGGAHVGYLVQKNGKTVTLISGNSGGRGPGRRVVAQGNYAKGRILGIVRPS